MKVIIAGTRSVKEPERLVSEAIEEAVFPISEIVTGMSGDIDMAAEAYAAEAGIPHVGFEPNWKEHGKAAGPIRNGLMADYAEGLIAIWDGKSPGTKDMIRQATNKRLRLHIKHAK